MDKIKTKKAIRLLRAGCTPIMVAQQLNLTLWQVEVVQEQIEEEDDDE